METLAEHYKRLLGLDSDKQVLDVELMLGIIPCGVPVETCGRGQSLVAPLNDGS
jgi:hypothetical protein